MFNELDQGYKDAVNGNMCNEFCVCPGQAGDAHYDEYKAIPEETLAKYDRTWDPADTGKTILTFAEGKPELIVKTTDTVK